MKPISYKDFIRKQKDIGFEGPFSGGKHQYMIKGNIRLTLPNPHRKEISIDLLIRLLRQAGISKEKWTEF